MKDSEMIIESVQVGECEWRKGGDTEVGDRGWKATGPPA